MNSGQIDLENLYEFKNLLVLIIIIFIFAGLSSYSTYLLAQSLTDENYVTYEKKSNLVKEFKIPVSERGLNGITTDNEGNVWIHHATNKSSTLFKMSKEGNNFTKYSISGNTLSDNAVINLAGGQLVFDNVSNAIWFTDARTNSLGKLNIDNGHMELFTIPTNNSGIMGLVLSPDRKTVWFTEIIGNNIGTFDIETKKITEYPTEENSGPTLLGFDRNGVLWVTLSYANSILRVEPWLLIPGITSSGMYKIFLEKPDYFSPFGIAVAEANGIEKIFLSDHGSSRIIISDINSDLKNYSLYWTSPSTALPVSLPSQVVSDKSGNVYFVEHGGNKIAKISSDSSTMTEFDIPTGPLATSVFLTVSADQKRIWFTEWASNKVGYIYSDIAEPANVRVTDVENNSSFSDVKPIIVKKGSSQSIDVFLKFNKNLTSMTPARNSVISLVGMTETGIQGIIYTTNPEYVTLTPDAEQQVKINLSVQPEKAIAGNYTIMLRATFFERDGLNISILYPLPIKIEI